MSLFGANGMSPADIAAVTGNCNNDGFGGNNGWWIILLLLACNGGWGNGFGGNGSGGSIPYFFNNTDAAMQRGFDTAAITNQLAGIGASISAGFANSEVANCNRTIANLQTDYNNQIASMNQSFANAQAMDSRLDNIVLQLQNCCCENRQNIADLKYIIAQEACATRSNTDAKVQMVMDKLCALQIEDLQSQNNILRSQLNEANRQASQAAQTATILQSQADQTQAIENYVRPQINPAYVVPNPYSCNCGWNYNGCCGNN